MDFTVIKKCGLTQTEFGMLCGVNRVTVNLWYRGKMNPNRHVADRVKRVVSLLSYAADIGALPMPKEKDRTKRQEQLAEILGSTARAKKEAMAAAVTE
jgi:DNA-binding XRE family transcriptional regulator